MGRRGKEEFDHANYGIFAGAEGLANINTMDVEQTPDAYVMTRTCEGCGELKQCMIDWAEIYCLQYGIMPAEVGRAIPTCLTRRGCTRPSTWSTTRTSTTPATGILSSFST
jgi:hypothetical protein